MIESKYSKKAILLYFALLIPILILYFISYIIIDTNRENLFQYELVVGLLLYSWFPTIFLYSIAQQYKVIRITEEGITIKKVLGLSTRKYRFEDFRRSDYIFGSHGTVLQSRNGEQITIGYKEFENYNQLVKEISSKVQAEHKIKVNYFSKGLITLILIGAILLLLFVINQMF